MAHDRRESRVSLRGERDRGPTREDLVHCRRQLAQREKQFAASGAVDDRVGAELGRQSQCEQDTGRQLGVERLGRRDAHLDIAAVGRVEHSVALVDEIALSAVDDRNDHRAPCSHEIDGAVRVGGRAGLRDRDDDRVAHVGGQLEP